MTPTPPRTLVPRILLLGDSIRQSYQPLVAAKLEGRAVVTGPADNCRFALYTAMRLGGWINECGKPDIIHWNNGLWDCGRHRGRGPLQFSVADYLANLQMVLTGLRGLTSRIIFATSTPVHPNRPTGPDCEWSWDNTDIERYNAAASDLMQQQGIPVNDMHAVVLAKRDTLLDPDMLHLTHAGRHACSDAVIAALDRHFLAG
jgi:lysophospholipase L1-like esterase